MKFDNSIIFEFLPDEDKKSFMVWDNIFTTVDGNIVAVYRAPFEERVFISMSDYNSKLKSKERDNKINDLLN